MKRRPKTRQLLASVWWAFFLFAGVFAIGQDLPPSPNDDLVKMIQATLPESVILNKIREGQTRWDRSVAALIALQKAGATERELAAITELPNAENTKSIMHEPVRDAGPMVETLGAQLFRTKSGDPYFRFESSMPEIFPNGLESNTAYLVLYKDELAVLVPAVAISYGGMDGDCSVMNVLFQHDRIVLDQYMFGACSLSAGPTETPLSNGVHEYQRAGLKITHGERVHHLNIPFEKIIYVEGKSKSRANDVVFGVYPYGFEAGPARSMRAALVDPFIDRMFKDFDETLAQLQKAAGLGDPSLLSPYAHYLPVSPALASRYKSILEQRWHESHTGGGNGWVSALNALQGLSNIQQAMAQAKVADANHDATGQMNAALSAGRSTIDTVGGSAPTYSNTKSSQLKAELSKSNEQSTETSMTGRSNNSFAARPGYSQSTQAGASAGSPITERQKPYSSNSCDDARDHLPPGSTVSAYQGCIPYKGKQTSSGKSNTSDAVGTTSGASSSAITHSVSPLSNGPLVAAAGPTYATTDAQGNTTLGVGTPKACAVTPSGSQLPLVPGTTAGTCNPASCRDMGYSVHLESKWTDEKKTEVVGTLTNNSLADATCTWAFHKNGVWTDYRGGFFKSGESQGGPLSGFRSMGVDSSTIKYVCFEGKDPVDVHGKACNAHLQFTGMTDAGTDR